MKASRARALSHSTLFAVSLALVIVNARTPITVAKSRIVEVTHVDSARAETCFGGVLDSSRGGLHLR